MPPITGQAGTQSGATSGGWRPPQWSKPPLWSVTVPGQTTQVSSVITDTSGQTLPGNNSSSTTQQGSPTTYFFDVVEASDHYLHREITKHPVQNNSTVTDHSYDWPDRVILRVRYSDAMQSYQQGQYSGGSRSVNAYQKFRDIKKSGQAVQLATHLDTYPMMVIEDVRASDTHMTTFGASFEVVFHQLIVATLSTSPSGTASSARPDSSQNQNAGNLNPTTADPATVIQHTTSLSNQGVPPELQPDTNPQLNSDVSQYIAP